jgi:hypothetical protein
MSLRENTALFGASLDKWITRTPEDVPESREVSLFADDTNPADDYGHLERSGLVAEQRNYNGDDEPWPF